MNGAAAPSVVRDTPSFVEVPAGGSIVHRPVPLDAPISAAVLVRVIVAERTAVLVGDRDSDKIEMRATEEWEVLDANCDLAKMRQVAAEYARENPGREAVVVTYADHCTAALAVNWGRP